MGLRGEGACWSGPLTPGPNKGLLKDRHRHKMDGTGAARPFVAEDEREQALRRVPQSPPPLAGSSASLLSDFRTLQVSVERERLGWGGGEESTQGFLLPGPVVPEKDEGQDSRTGTAGGPGRVLQSV